VANDYRDPGWYAQPTGSVAFEWQGAAPAAAPRAAPAGAPVPRPRGGHGNH